MRNLNVFVCRISLRFSDAMGNKTLFAIFLRGGTGMHSAENNNWISEHTSVFHNVNHAAAKQTHFPSWLAGEPKQAMCLVAEALFISGKFIRISQKTQFAAAHEMELHSSMWRDDDTNTTNITLHVWGTSTVQMCSCVSLGFGKSDNLLFNTI